MLGGDAAVLIAVDHTTRKSMAQRPESTDRSGDAKISFESRVEKPVRLVSRRREQLSAGSFRGSNSASRGGTPALTTAAQTVAKAGVDDVQGGDQSTQTGKTIPFAAAWVITMDHQDGIEGPSRSSCRSRPAPGRSSCRSSRAPVGASPSRRSSSRSVAQPGQQSRHRSRAQLRFEFFASASTSSVRRFNFQMGGWSVFRR